MDAGLAGILGGLVGAGGSIGAVFVQSWFSAKRERARFALEMAYKQREADAERARQGQRILPIDVYAHYHIGILDLVERNKVTRESLERLMTENRLLHDVDRN